MHESVSKRVEARGTGSNEGRFEELEEDEAEDKVGMGGGGRGRCRVRSKRSKIISILDRRPTRSRDLGWRRHIP